MKEENPRPVNTPPKKVNRVSDVIPAPMWPSREVRPLDSILNIEVLVEEYQERDGNFGKWAVIACRDVEDTTIEYVVMTGGAVVLRKLGEIRAAEAFPIIGMFRQPGRYYDLV